MVAPFSQCAETNLQAGKETIGRVEVHDDTFQIKVRHLLTFLTFTLVLRRRHCSQWQLSCNFSLVILL